MKNKSNIEFVGGSKHLKNLELPLFLEPVKAGFPSPNEGHEDRMLDLNEHLITHPAATYFVRAKGDSMKDEGIFDGDILVVDKALDPRSSSIVVASLDNEFVVKKFFKNGNQVKLISANSEYKDILIDGSQDFQVWGTVISIIRKLL